MPAVPGSLRSIGCALLAAPLVAAFAWLPGSADARPKKARDCKAAGPPTQLETQGAVDLLFGIERGGERWAVRPDRLEKPRKIELLAITGEASKLAKPPPAVVSQFLGHPMGVYALGTARSLSDGESGVTLVRWANRDRRARVSHLWRTPGGVERLVGQVVGDHMVVGWVDRAADGKARWKAGVVALEGSRAGELLELSMPADAAGISGHVAGSREVFATAWTAGGKTAVQLLDRAGTPKGPRREVEGVGESGVVGLAQCEGHTYLLHGAKKGTARLVRVDEGGVEVLWTIKSVIDAREMQMTCTGESAVIARRTFNRKAEKVTFWVTTVGPDGQSRDRRVKEMQGEPRDIQLPRLAGQDESLTAFWLEQEGARKHLMARDIACR